MKKHLLLFVFAFAASAVCAQTNDMYSILFRDMAGCHYSVTGLMQQSDEDFVTTHFNFLIDGDSLQGLGNTFYKISSDTHTITDTLFEAGAFWNGLLARNPRGEGNIRCTMEYHEDCDSTFLRICRFPDSDLHADPGQTIVTPLCEGINSGFVGLIDSKGDLVIQYEKAVDMIHHNKYVSRFGLDGTLKHHVLLHENVLIGQGVGELHAFKESPLTYYQWGEAGTSSGPWENLNICLLDSLFNKNPIIISSVLSETEDEFLCIQYDTKVIPADGDNVLVAAEYVYERNHNNPSEDEYGVVVAKYDLRTMQQKGFIVFNDYPGRYSAAKCLGLQMMTDGTVYFLYTEEGYPEESFIAVKMDTDLNVEWKRFCKTDGVAMFYLPFSDLCKDGQGGEKGIAWVGDARNTMNNTTGFLYLNLNHDGPVDINENKIEVRPYCFYPNPAKDQLRFQFSPDVQPKQVELYDLQGRLVHTQSGGFESIDTGRLPAGTYMLRVTMDDGSVYSDKVVKE